MDELTTTQAADIVGQHRTTVWHWLNNGALPGRKRGQRGDWIVKADDLRKFAAEHNYDFDEEKAAEFAK